MTDNHADEIQNHKIKNLARAMTEQLSEGDEQVLGCYWVLHDLSFHGINADDLVTLAPPLLTMATRERWAEAFDITDPGQRARALITDHADEIRKDEDFLTRLEEQAQATRHMLAGRGAETAPKTRRGRARASVCCVFVVLA